MDRLPSEILLMIFRRIDDFRLMLKLEQVCRWWRQVMRNHGWKHVRQAGYGRLDASSSRVIKLTPGQWVVPIGEHCGNYLVECNFYSVPIDSNLMRLIAGNLRALRHLKFDDCQLQGLDANALDPFPEFGARLRSLSFSMNRPQLSHTFLRHFPRLRHLGFNIPFTTHNWANEISGHFSGHLRSLFLNCFVSNNSDQEQMLAKVRAASTGLKVLWLNFFTVTRPMLLQISEMKNLRYLHIHHFDDFALLSSCLANLPHLRAFKTSLNIQHLPDLLGFPFLRGLAHLRLSLFVDFSDNCASIGLLATTVPQLRSLSLEIDVKSPDQAQKVGCELLKMARNGILEYLNVPDASFSIEGIDQLVHLCPNLHSFNAQLSNRLLPQSSEVAELRSVVAHQWGAGMRKHLPLRIWIHEKHDRVPSDAIVWQDPFLIVRYSYFFAPLNPVLDKLFREEVFNDGIPSFVTDYYDDHVAEPLASKSDLMII